jgi:hypothetical protein
MASRSSSLRLPRAREATRDPIRYSLRPRLTAIAPSTVEVVRSAGGWLFDQVMAGWDVTVLTADHGDSRPLEILGARVRDLEAILALPLVGGCLQAIAVRADLYESDERVRGMVLRAAGEGQADIRFWGDFRREDRGPGAGRLSHRLSLAARAFKAQALAAAGESAGVADPAGLADPAVLADPAGVADPAGLADPAGVADPADPAQDVETFRRGQVRRPSPAAAR